ncbi:tRNA (adenosine(37)-N6)-dimethylallyltransferase MiaA [Alphaproteobacteria bacterium]|nr:tRNA (adenosine(37)-N6)-dimethylallyltransferase MiaA [Alphaproteobacteria bacterium]MDC1022930.1 tRNA (adenosine(37)-N6)-dimethylallyltransferase MiaA [Alphaproteobacteria bacterium]
MSSVVNFNKLFDLSKNKYSWKDDMIIIAGPTCVGKSNIAIELAKKINGVIINADSVQVYKDLSLLSARPTIDEMDGIPHFLYGYVDRNITFSVIDWLLDIQSILVQVKSLKKLPILVGGSGLYLNAVINGLAPIPSITNETKDKSLLKFNQVGIEEFRKINFQIDPLFIKNNIDKHRLLRSYSVFVQTGKNMSFWHNQSRDGMINKVIYPFLLCSNRQILYNKCNNRFNEMLLNGGLDEVRLIHNKVDKSSPIARSLGVKWLLSYLDNEICFEDAVKLSMRDTRRYVKRQITWFKHNYIPYKVINL